MERLNKCHLNKGWDLKGSHLSIWHLNLFNKGKNNRQTLRYNRCVALLPSAAIWNGNDNGNCIVDYWVFCLREMGKRLCGKWFNPLSCSVIVRRRLQRRRNCLKWWRMLLIILEDMILWMPLLLCYCSKHRTEVVEVPTRAFDLPDIVARKPPSPAIKHPLPPAAVLLTSHANDITLSESELILIGLLEVETCLHQQLLSTVFWHVLTDGEGWHRAVSRERRAETHTHTLWVPSDIHSSMLGNEPDVDCTTFITHHPLSFSLFPSLRDFTTLPTKPSKNISTAVCVVFLFFSIYNHNGSK